MKLELVVVFFPPNLAISPALNRVSKIEAVMMSHDPAKNNNAALTWLPPWPGARAWRPAGRPTPPGDLPGAPFLPLPKFEPSSPDSPPHSSLLEKGPGSASAAPLLYSCSENPDSGQRRRLGAESTQAQTATS